MPVEAVIDDAEYRMRQALGSGEIEGESFDISLNIDGKGVFIEFDDERVMYTTADMVQDAYKTVYVEEDDNE